MDPDNWSPIAKVYDPLMVGSIDTTDDEPHDHGIVRAMNATYKPNKDVVGDPHNTVFVARLNPKTVEDTLHDEFSCFGEIQNLRLIKDIVTGTSRCYAFIEFMDEKSAYRAQRDGNKMILDGSEIFVDFEHERTLKGWIPRRLGGGFGGKKESGQLRFGGKDRPFRKPIMANMKSFNREDFGKERLGTRDEGYDRQSSSGRGYRDDRHRDYNRDRSKRDRFNDRSRDRDRSSRDRDRRKSRERRDRYRDRSRERKRSQEKDSS